VEGGAALIMGAPIYTKPPTPTGIFVYGFLRRGYNRE